MVAVDMAPLTFAVTWDYRCPFAANAHDHIIEALLDGVDWDVTFIPFSLGQTHVAEGEIDVWNDPTRDSGIVALQAGVAVRDLWPDRFLALHRALFRARHVEGRKIRDEHVVREVLGENGIDVGAVFDQIDRGTTLQTIRKEHEGAAAEHEAWGVPTFIAGDRAVFVRLMSGANGDAGVARSTIERVLDAVTGWTDLNEFKHTSVPK